MGQAKHLQSLVGPKGHQCATLFESLIHGHLSGGGELAPQNMPEINFLVNPGMWEPHQIYLRNIVQVTCVVPQHGRARVRHLYLFFPLGCGPL